MLDFTLCSHSLFFKLIDYLQDECKLGHGGRLGYIDAISELIDFRKINGASDTVLRNLSSTELYLSDLTFATKFLAAYLFIKVKGSRPMTYQYLTVDMVRTAKENGGFIDQKKSKTASKCGFDTLHLNFDRCKHAGAR